MCTQWTLNYPMRLCRRSCRFQWVLDAFITRRLEIYFFFRSDRGLHFFCVLSIQVIWKAVCVLFYSVIYSSHVVNSLVILQSVWFNKKLSQEVFLKTLIMPYVCCFPTQWLLNEENKNSFGCKVTQSFYPKLSNPLQQPQPISSTRLSPCRNDEKQKRHSWFFHQYLSSGY